MIEKNIKLFLFDVRGWTACLFLCLYWRFGYTKAVEPCSGFTVHQFGLGPLCLSIYS